MTLRRVLIGLSVAGLAVGLYAWSLRETGSIVVQFERWESDERFERRRFPVLSISNSTSRMVTVDMLALHRFGTSPIFKIGDDPSNYNTFTLLPNTEQEFGVWPLLDVAGDQAWEIEGEIDVTVVPWTHDQWESAHDRYAGWPKPLMAWLTRKYTVRPEHRYTVQVPPPPGSLPR